MASDNEGVGIDIAKELGVKSKATDDVNATPADREVTRSHKAQTYAAVNAQPKLRIFVPEEMGDQVVKINSAAWTIKAGEDVEVPRQVAEMLHAKWRAERLANKPRQLDLGSI